jgi:LmbE family N-acetylglucosaminyl deacetylase
MGLIVDQEHPGTPESVWLGSGRLDALPTLDLGRPRRVVVVAPHPDDEVVGAGGLLHTLIASGVPFEILAVTDGEASHPKGGPGRARDLTVRRPQETLRALRRLGCPTPMVTRLGIPDGRVTEHEDQVGDAVAGRARPGDLWFAPWPRDGHPDHDACGRATDAVTSRLGVRSLGYLVWAWHWADPSGDDLPWADCRRFDLDQPTLSRKRWSIEAFRSQIRPLGPDPGATPVLPTAVLARFWRRVEVYVDGGSAG